MKPTVIGLTSWPNPRDGVLTRREPAPTTFAAPANMLRREIESDIVISLAGCNKPRRHRASPHSIERRRVSTLSAARTVFAQNARGPIGQEATRTKARIIVLHLQRPPLCR